MPKSVISQRAKRIDVAQTPTVAPLSSYIVRSLRHELVQPLHSLNLMIDLVPLGGSEADFAQWADRLDRALSGMKRMIAGLGDAARLEIEPPPLTLVEQSLEPILGAVADSHRDLAAHVGAAIELVPGTHTAVTDRSMVRLGLDRLIDNALRHAGAQHVTLRVERRDEGLLIEVRDDGTGIEPADRERCLAPLGTGSTARIKGSAGLGMGLTVAQQVAALLGYGFYFRSSPEEGTSAGYLIPAPSTTGS